MAFRDLADILGASPPKVLPIHGRDVEFPGRISAWAGQCLLAIQHAASAARSSTPEDVLDALELSDEDALRLELEVLGDGAAVLDELGILGDARSRVVTTLTAWHLAGEDAAAVAWEGKGSSRMDRRRKPKRKRGRSSKTGGSAGGRSKGAGGGSSGRQTPRSPGTDG